MEEYTALARQIASDLVSLNQKKRFKRRDTKLTVSNEVLIHEVKVGNLTPAHIPIP